MLKIEVIKFEAQDVITASVEQKPVEEAKCTCPKAPLDYNTGVLVEEKEAALACQREKHPGCDYTGTHQCEFTN